MGETPFVKTESSTDPVAVISVLTYTPETGDCELYFRSQQDHFDGDSICSFLRDVAEFLPRDVMFILDNLPAHFPAVAQLRDELAETATEVAVEWLPTYAPELNPTGFVWRESKYVELANYAPKDLDSYDRGSADRSPQSRITNRSCDPVSTSQNSYSENEVMILRL